LDSGCGDYERFWLTSSLRGAMAGTINVQILKNGVHSGHASGIVPSSFRIARILLDRIEDAQTGNVLVPELNKEIPQTRIKQQKECADIIGHSLVEEFPWVESASRKEDLLELLLNRTWRPTISYTGVAGIPAVEIGGNVLRAETTLKLSVRLPPHVLAKDVENAVKKTLESNPPYGALVTWKTMTCMAGWASPELAPWLENAIATAGQTVFGKKHGFLGEGGSIPFMGMLGEKFPLAQFVITGVLGPQSNAHGPNEFLHIEMVKNVTTVVAYVLSAQAKQ